jgi:pimeloyl-ACP methyl ester carboxylesterase
MRQLNTRRRFAVTLLVTALVSTGVAVCGEGAESAAAPSASHHVSRIAWGRCPAAAEGAHRDPRLTCGTVKVPLDYRHPRGTTISVAVSRLPTAKRGKRHGDLLLNPGGPALPGLDMPSTMAPTLPASVTDRYDLIGFDPRGVEHSTAQSCGLADPTVSGLFPYPAADGSITANVDLARADAEKCASNATKLRYFTTANTARDLDRVRQALGEKKISYWGQSYGTYLGAVYEALFPSRADRVILEGNVDPTKVWAKAADSWGKGMAERFPDAAGVAAAQHGTLGLGSTVQQVTQTYLTLAGRLDSRPAPVAGTPLSLSGSMLRNVTYALLLHNETLPVLTQFWKAAADLADGATTDADAAVLQQVFADAPATPGVPADNQATMFLALTCGDAAWSNEVSDYATRTAASRASWPLTAGMPDNIWACAFWPAPIESPVKVGNHGPRNTLILQNRRDNATPWDGGVGLHHVLGNRSALVGVDNGGHYVYHAGSACADKATVDFLTTGHLPKKDVDCTDV